MGKMPLDGCSSGISRCQPSFLRIHDILRSDLMSLRNAIRTFTEQARDLLALLHSSEGDTLGRNDLDALEIQLYLLDKEVTRRKGGVHPPDVESMMSQ